MTTQSDQRTEIGLTQEQAARRAGVSVATWRRWERNPDSVTDDVRVQCQRALDQAEDGQWDDMEAILKLCFGRNDLTMAERKAELMESYVNLASICYELHACHLKPSALLRGRFGQAVVRTLMCETLAAGRSQEDAAAAVSALFEEAGIPRQYPRQSEAG